MTFRGSDGFARFFLCFALASVLTFVGCGEDNPTEPDDLPPTAISIANAVPGPFSVTLHWRESGDDDFAQYVIERSAAGVSEWTMNKTDPAASPDSHNSTNSANSTDSNNSTNSAASTDSSNLTSSANSTNSPKPTDPRLEWIELATSDSRSDTLFTDTLVSPRHLYRYRLRVRDASEQQSTGDSLEVTTLPADRPVCGIEPVVPFSDFAGSYSLYVDGVDSLATQITDVVVVLGHGEDHGVASCQTESQPHGDWLSLCRVEAEQTVLGFSRLPAGTLLVGGGHLGSVEWSGLDPPLLLTSAEILGESGENLYPNVELRGTNSFLHRPSAFGPVVNLSPMRNDEEFSACRSPE